MEKCVHSIDIFTIFHNIAKQSDYQLSTPKNSVFHIISFLLTSLYFKNSLLQNSPGVFKLFRNLKQKFPRSKLLLILRFWANHRSSSSARRACQGPLRFLRSRKEEAGELRRARRPPLRHYLKGGGGRGGRRYKHNGKKYISNIHNNVRSIFPYIWGVVLRINVGKYRQTLSIWGHLGIYLQIMCLGVCFHGEKQKCNMQLIVYEGFSTILLSWWELGNIELNHRNVSNMFGNFTQTRWVKESHQKQRGTSRDSQTQTSSHKMASIEPEMTVWKMIFIFKGCILRFHVNFRECKLYN